MKTNVTTAANGYMVIGNSNINTDNGILFCYFNATSSLRFFNTSGYNHPITANTWYHIEARNVNWTTRTMDIWIDNVLILTGWAFRSTTAIDVDRVHLFSLSAAEVRYDEIQIGLGGPIVSNLVTLDPLCFGDSTGGIDITASSTNGALTYSWSNGATTEDLQNLPGGTYAVSITDPLGCSLNTTYTLNSPAQIAPIAVPTNVLCPGGGGGALDVTVSGGTPGYTYLWSSGDTTEDLSSLMGGSYSLTVTDLNGCEGQNNFSVGEPSPFVGSANVTLPTCANGGDGMIDYSLIGGNGGNSYLWNTADTTEDLSGLSAATYTVLVTDSLGCLFQDSVQVGNPAAILSNPQIGEPSCFSFGNGHIDLTPSGGLPTYTYLWSTGATSQNLPSASAGTYFVTITDANGCISVDSFLVTQPAQIISSGTVVNSTGGNTGMVDLLVSGGTPPFTYLWSNSATTQDVSGLAGPATYTVLITDANGCQVTDTFFVDEVIAVTNAMGTTFSVWPNPFDHSFTVALDGVGIAPVTLSLVDLAGREVWQHVQTANGQATFSVDVPRGVYLLRFEQGGNVTTLKMIKQ